MAKRISSSSEPNRPSRLKFSPQDAGARLRQRVDSGKEIVTGPFENQGQLEDAKKKYSTWFQVTQTLLRHMFDTDQEVKRFYGFSLGWMDDDRLLSEQVAFFVDHVNDRIRTLEALIESLDVYQLAPEVHPTPQSTSRHVPQPTGKKVFVVHGRDDALKNAVCRFVERMGLEAVVLHEQADRGRTLIEKFTDHAKEVVFAIVLLTGDDVGRLATDDETKSRRRARQNVILELGFFLANLSPERVCALYKDDVELPTDLAGRLYTLVDPAGAWQFQVAKEMHAAGIEVDLHRLL